MRRTSWELRGFIPPIPHTGTPSASTSSPDHLTNRSSMLTSSPWILSDLQGMPWTTSWLRSPNHPERSARTSSTAPSAGSRPPTAWHFNVSSLRLFWNPLTAYPADAIRFTLCFRAIQAQRIGHLIGGLTSPALVQSSRKPCPHDLSPFAPAARHSRTGHAESKGPFSHRRYKSRLLISKGGDRPGTAHSNATDPRQPTLAPGLLSAIGVFARNSIECEKQGLRLSFGEDFVGEVCCVRHRLDAPLKDRGRVLTTLAAFHDPLQDGQGTSQAFHRIQHLQRMDSPVLERRIDPCHQRAIGRDRAIPSHRALHLLVHVRLRNPSRQVRGLPRCNERPLRYLHASHGNLQCLTVRQCSVKL